LTKIQLVIQYIQATGRAKSSVLNFIQRKDDAWMYVTLSDLIAFAMFILMLIALIKSYYDTKK